MGLELELMGIDDADLATDLEYLDEGDFDIDGSLEDLTEDLDYGWDDVTTESGAEILEQYESNFENPAIYDRSYPIETFDDYGMDDFGGGMDDHNFDFDW